MKYIKQTLFILGITMFLLPIRAHATWVYTAGDVSYKVGGVTADAGPDINLVFPAGSTSATGTASSGTSSIASSTWTYVGCTPSCVNAGVVGTPNAKNTGTHTTTLSNMDNAAVGTHFTYRYQAEDSDGDGASNTMDVIIVAAAGTNLTAKYLSPSTANPGKVTLTGKITNEGGTKTDAAFTSYFEVQGDNTLTWTSPAISLDGGESDTVTVDRSFSSGIYQVRVCADGAGKVTESDNNDNCSDWSTLKITGSVAGSCSASHYLCSAGTSTDNVNGATKWTWTCQGSGGASDATCSESKATDGICAATHYSCTSGASINNVNGAVTWNWSCTGMNGGSDTMCLESKSGTAACSDGYDNDGDGKTDFMQDPGCTSPADGDENNPKPNFIEL